MIPREVDKLQHKRLQCHMGSPPVPDRDSPGILEAMDDALTLQMW